jgi:hypothetical protein
VVIQPLCLQVRHRLAGLVLHPFDGLVQASLRFQRLKHLRTKLLEVVVDLPPETVEPGHGAPPDLNHLLGSYRPSMRQPEPLGLVGLPERYGFPAPN